MRTNQKLAGQLREVFTKERAMDDSTRTQQQQQQAAEATKTFRDYYMEQITTAFGDELDALRQVSIFP